MVGENEFEYLYESTKELLAPLRALFLSLTTESNKTYWLVATIVIPPVMLGLALYFRDDESTIEKMKTKKKVAAKKSE